MKKLIPAVLAVSMIFATAVIAHSSELTPSAGTQTMGISPAFIFPLDC